MTQDILKDCTVEGNIVKLPIGQLDRNVYLEIKKKLELIGGKWKGGKTQGFVFEEDPTELLEAVANGEDRNLKKEYQFFATPPEVAKRVIDMLPEMNGIVKVLEPSAGDGALIKAFKHNYSHPDQTVDCYELMDLNRMKLAKFDGVRIRGNDFLECANKEDYYDIIIANPPFTKNQDIDHIRKMYEVCKPGGTIVTLSSPSWRIGRHRKQVEFKMWLEEIGADIREIEAGAFKESGTSVGCLMIRIKKEGGQELYKNSELIQNDFEDPEQNICKENDTLKVHLHTFLSFENSIDLTSLKNGKISHLINIDGKKYCLSGAIGTGTGQGWASMSAYEVIALADYKGGKEPLSYYAHFKEVDEGKRKRDYDGLLSEYKGEKFVLIGPEKIILPEEKKKITKKVPAPKIEERICRVCGCTQDNCIQCIEKTGEPCHWVEDDLCSACANEIKEYVEKGEIIEPEFESSKFTELIADPCSNFFREFYSLLDGIDVSIKLKRKNGRLTLSVLPETTSVLSPVILTGTPEELDAGFFQAINKPVTEASGLKVDLDNYKKSVEKQKAESVKAAAENKKPDAEAVKKKAKGKKKEAEKEVKKEETKIIKPDLFANV